MAILNTDIGFESGRTIGASGTLPYSTAWRFSDSNSSSPGGTVTTESGGARSGTYCVHIYNPSTDTRFEIRCLDDLGYSPGRFNWYQEYWLGISVRTSNWASQPLEWNSIVQCHAVPYNQDWTGRTSSANCWHIYGTDGSWGYSSVGYKNIFLASLPLDGTYDATHLTEDPYSTTPPISHRINTPIWHTPLTNVDNQWIDIVLNFIISPGPHVTLNPGVVDGKMKMWFNGSLVVNFTGPNVYYYDTGGMPAEPYGILQTGSYKGVYTDTSRNSTINVYYDELRVGDSSESYSSVAPGGSSGSGALGPELLVNAWDDSEADVSEAGGVITFSNTGNVCDTTFTNPGVTCRLEFDCDVTSGSFQIRDLNTDYTTGQITSSNHYSYDVILTGSYLVVDASNASPFTGTVYNITLKEITTASLIGGTTIELIATGTLSGIGDSVLGPELIVNAWDDSEADVSEAGGVITFTNTGNICDTPIAAQTSLLRLTFDCVVTSGSFQIRDTNTNDTTGQITSTGSYSFDVNFTDTYVVVDGSDGNPFTGTVSNISLKVISNTSSGSTDIKLTATGTLIAKGKLDASSSNEEVIINGTFDSSSNWSVGTGWSITGGEAVATAATGALVQYFNKPSDTYVLTVDITVTSGLLQIYGNDWVGWAGGSAISSTGSYSKEITGTLTNIVFLYYSSAFTGTVDNVTIKPKVTGDVVLNLTGQLIGRAQMLGSIDIELFANGDLGGQSKASGNTDIKLIATATLLGRGKISGSSDITIQLDDNIVGHGRRTGSADIELIATADLVGKGSPSGTLLITLNATGILKGRGQAAGSSDIELIAIGTLVAHGLRRGSADITLVASGDLGEYEIIRGEILELDSYVTTEIELDSYVTTELNLDSYLQ